MSSDKLVGDILYEKLLDEIFNSLANQFKYVGSRVFLNDKGEVEAKILSLNECMEVIEKRNNGEVISEEFTIQEISDIFNEQNNDKK